LVHFLLTGASKGTPGDAKCVTEILGGQKQGSRGGAKFTFLFQGVEGTISALKWLNSHTNVLIFMSKNALKLSYKHL